MLSSSRGLPADEVVIDLEDAVVPAQKVEARGLVAAALAEGGWSAPTVAVRINDLQSPWWEQDVAEVVTHAGEALDCLVVPKVESAEQLERVAAELERAERAGERSQSVGLEALIETAAGLARAGEIAHASPRLEALIVGYADLAASLGRPFGTREGGPEWSFAAETVLLAARDADAQAIDGPQLDIADTDRLRSTAEFARALGYDGKWAVHPSQVEPLNEAFAPTQDELDRAAEVLAALERAEGDDSAGAASHDGAMIDEASRKQADLVMARAAAAGLEPSG
jgi:citrate lyase subunit beta / citryl-CoA lyase